MAAILIGLTGAGMLALGVGGPWPVDGLVIGIWDLIGIGGVIVSVGLLESF